MKARKMKKTITHLFLACASGVLVSSCSDDSLSETGEISLNATSTANTTTQNITVADLVGTWNMQSMTSVPLEEGGQATAVDFDQNGNSTYDLLEETDCFDAMYFIFHDTGVVNTRQSRLFFSAETGGFTCLTTGDYTATYTVSGDILTVNFTVNGSNYTETRTIARYSENGKEFLRVTLTKEETNAAVYVAKDPGNTVASEIQKIEMVYIRTQ